MNPNPRSIDTDERAALTAFVLCEIGLDELISRLGGMVEINFGTDVRGLTSHFTCTEPGVRVTLWMIDNALAKRARGEWTAHAVMDWATMILLNDQYDWNGSDEEEIADRLDALSLPQVFGPDPRNERAPTPRPNDRG